MLSYSPYDNLGAHDYPAMFVHSGLWDSQVQYFEPTKYVARLRARRTGDSLIVLRTNMEAGHGGKPGRYEDYREHAEQYAFIIDQAGLTKEWGQTPFAGKGDRADFHRARNISAHGGSVPDAPAKLSTPAGLARSRAAPGAPARRLRVAEARHACRHAHRAVRSSEVLQDSRLALR